MTSLEVLQSRYFVGPKLAWAVLFLRKCRKGSTCKLKDRIFLLLVSLQNPHVNLKEGYFLPKNGELNLILDAALPCNTAGHRVSPCAWHSAGQRSGSQRNVFEQSSSSLRLALQQGSFGQSAGLHCHSCTVYLGTCCGFREGV